MTPGVVHDSRPILVSGVYRSGTTFLAAMLGAHPGLAATSSTVKFLRFCNGRYGDLARPECLDALVRETARRVRVRWEIEIDANAVLADLATRDDLSYARAYDVIMRHMLTAGRDDVRWVEKLAMQWTDVPLFLEMFPNGRVLHIIRDPRDVTASYKAMTFEPGNTFLDAAFNCRSSMEHARRYERSHAAGFLVVRAEDLAADPQAGARQLCGFLDIAYDDRMVDAAEFHAEGEDWASNTSFGQSFDRIRPLAPRWPDNLSTDELALVELVTQPYLCDFGYEHSGCVPKPEQWQRIAALCDDSFLAERLRRWFVLGEGSQGYRTDPYEHEMKIVFPERYEYGDT